MEECYANILTDLSVNEIYDKNHKGGSFSAGDKIRAEHKIGNTTYIVTCVCTGTELLSDKIKRMIFHDCGAIS